MSGFAVGVDLGELDLAVPRVRTASSSAGPSVRHGPHHSAQKSTTTGTCLERSMTFAWKSCSLTSLITSLSLERPARGPRRRPGGAAGSGAGRRSSARATRRRRCRSARTGTRGPRRGPWRARRPRARAAGGAIESRSAIWTRIGQRSLSDPGDRPVGPLGAGRARAVTSLRQVGPAIDLHPGLGLLAGSSPRARPGRPTMGIMQRLLAATASAARP